ncbi:MAG: COX15/CtaA family protein [Defluviicoccus sp.]|nr:COX15/CtaA family protein [Defluviicoccus sp.]MDE0277565.1 COX15/CtaA family protein [Defluviicoccus sp.]
MPARETDRAVALWLYICCAAIFAMVVLGGLTRLTGSGLSMVTWQPVTGWLPPLDAAGWEAVFALYRETPEFRRVNFWMTVDDFRSIFWLEYLHRLWGRLIGVVFAVPAVWFAVRGRIGRRLGIGLFLAFLLGAGQGALGWYMVQSGLVDRPEVSHYRLAAHLFLALAVYAWLFWLALGLTQERGGQGALDAHIGLVIAGIALTAIWGAFVAGLDAGHIHPTFPLMDGRLVPREAFSMAPWAADLTGNPVTVQLVHRWLAMLVLAAILALWWRVRRLPQGQRLAFDLLAVTGILQAGLGVATLLLGVPLAAASLHQAGGVVLLSLAVYALHASRRARI